LSEYALTGTEVLDLNGKYSIRQKLFADNFATTNVEQFSAIFDMRMLSKAIFHVLNLGTANGLKYTITVLLTLMSNGNHYQTPQTRF
jgi:hypothetical protein